MRFGKAIGRASAWWQRGPAARWLLAVATAGVLGSCRDDAAHPVLVTGNPVDSAALQNVFKGLLQYGAALNIKVTGF